MIKNQLKQTLALILVVFMLVPFLPLDAIASTQIKGSEKVVKFTIGQQTYEKGGTKVLTDVAPYIKDSRTMVPVAFVAPALGTDPPVWIPENQMVRITRGDDLIMITIGSKGLVVNGKILMMDTAAEIKAIDGGGGRTMLPIAFIARALNVGYQWDEESKSVDFYGYSENFHVPGTFGPTLGTEIVYGNVTVSSGDVRLQNKIIKGNLVIAESVGKGNVFLDNITVEGNTYVRGGGRDSIHINGGSFTNIIIENTPEGGTRIVATNSEGINIVVATGQAGELVVLEGTFANVEITATNAVVNTQGETTIQNIVVNNNATLTVAAGTTVQNIAVNAAATITGAGTVNVVTANTSNVVISTTTQPTVIMAPGVIPPTIQPAVSSPASTNGGESNESEVTVPVGALGGNVSITGSLKYDQVLTANVSLLTGNTGTLSYQWKRGGTEVGGNQNTYRAVESDIGQTITVEVTSSIETGTIIGTAGSPIVKADEPARPSAPTLASRTDTTIVLNVIAGAEYNVDGGEWQDSPEFTGLTPLTEYTFRARIKETTTHIASLSSSPTSITTEAIVLPTATAALTDDDDSDGAVSSPVVVANTGGTLNYTLTLTGLEADKDVTYTVTETSDPDNILTLPVTVTGDLTSIANEVQLTFQVAANAVGQPAKTASFTISFVGEDYQPISDILVVVNLAGGE